MWEKWSFAISINTNFAIASFKLSALLISFKNQNTIN